MAKKSGSGGSAGRDFEAGPGGLGIEEFARWYREQEIKHWNGLDLKAISEITRAIERARDMGRQIFVMGNGGSAAIASQLATDLSKTAAAPGKSLLL